MRHSPNQSDQRRNDSDDRRTNEAYCTKCEERTTFKMRPNAVTCAMAYKWRCTECGHLR